MSVPPFLRRFWPVIFLALIPLIPLYRAVFLGEAIGPFDQIRQMAPWNGPKPAQPWDVLQADGVLQFYVWRDLVFGAYGKGQLPFWNSYQLAGTPLLANSQSGALYPPHILMGILHMPTAAAMTLLAWFHLFLAGLGAYLLSRRLGANRIGGAVAGASFALSSFMISWTGLPSVIETVAWIPWVLALILMVFDENPHMVRWRDVASDSFVPPKPENPNPHDFVRLEFQRRRRWNLLTVSLALSTAMMILAGHLQFVAYGFIAIVLLMIWLWITLRNPFLGEDVAVHRLSMVTKRTFLKRSVVDSNLQADPGEPITDPKQVKRLMSITNPRLWSSLRVIYALILGVMIAAPQLLAVLNYSQFSHRRNTPTDAGYQQFLSGAIQPYELIKIVAPTIQGNPRQFASDQLPVSTYYPALLHAGANFAESAIGLGVFVALLMCMIPLVLRKRDPVGGLLAIGLFGLCIALGTPVNQLFYFGVPGWSSTGSPGRAICLFVLAACVVGGVAVSRLFEFKEDIKKIRVAALVFGALVIVCLALKNEYNVPERIGIDAINQIKDLAESSAFPGIIGVAALSALAIFLAVREQTFRSKALLLAVPILSAIAFFGTTLIQTAVPNLSVLHDLGMQRIAVINNSWELIGAAHASLPPNIGSFSRIHSLDGYDSLIHRDTVALLKDIDGQDPAAAANGNMMFVKPTADLKKLADAGVTEVWSQKAVPGLSDPTQYAGLMQFKLAGPGRASTPHGPAEILSETLSQIKLHAVGPGKLVVRERNMPGWLAKIDGVHISISGTTWMEIELTPGEHTVELNYVPPGFMPGIFLAAIGWMIVFLLGLLPILLDRVRLKTS